MTAPEREQDPLEEPRDGDPDFDVEDPPLEPTDVSEAEALAAAATAGVEP